MPESYFKVEGYVSNSWLGQFKRFINEESNQFASIKALEFGSTFHKVALEPHLYENEARNFVTENMRDSLDSNMAYRFMRNHKDSKIEHEYYVRCKTTGVWVKMKIDLQLYAHQADIKSTSCNSLSSFKDSCLQYNYNRQAAFYMDHAKGEKFTFFGVQKKHPYRVFTISYDKNSKEVMEGREEYLYLINKAKSIGVICV